MTDSTTASTRPKLRVRASLRDGYRLSLHAMRQSLVLVLLVQGAVVVVASPLLIGTFDLALRAAGIASVTDTTIVGLVSSPLGLTVAVLAAIATVAALLLQAAIFIRVADDRKCGRTTTFRSTFDHVVQVGRRLLRKPSTLLLVPYLLLLIPLGRVGENSFLTRWVAVPAFVSDELLKEPSTAIAYLVLMLAILYINVRLIFVVPLLLLHGTGMVDAAKRSWRLTRWRTPRVLALVAGVAIPASVTVAAFAFLALLPPMVADAIAPDSAVFVAAVSFSILQVAVFVALGFFALVQTQTLVAALHTAGEASNDSEATFPAASGAPTPSRRAPALVAAAGAVIATVVLAAHAVPIMGDVADGNTLVLAHRGFTQGGVENTLPSLEAAHDAGADVVEMDIQQTADGGWVLMHDMNLSRLAGLDTAVSDLTQAEATQITVRDADHSAPIPSLETYLDLANEIDQPLLIEVKIHGGESANYLDELLALLDEHGGAESFIYHSLSADVVEGLTSRRPHLVVGYIVALSFGGVPDSPADFFVLEQSAYSEERKALIHDTGRGVFVWTVQDAESMRALFRENVDGIITDYPDVALAQLSDVADDTGVTDRFFDAIERIIVPMQ